MNCNDFAEILDERALGRLSVADRCALGEHVTSCEPCAFAWAAQSALLALPIPAAPTDLLDRVLRAMSVRPPQPRSVRPRVVLFGALLAAGAALAAITTARLLEPGGGESTTSKAGDARDSAQAPGSASRSSTPETTAGSGPETIPVALDDVDIELSYALRVAPDYPPEALERKLEGDVTIEYTIDGRGVVKNAHVVRSSDPLFESSAVAAVSRWKYLPRVRAGKPVPVGGMQTVLRFQLEMPPPPPIVAKHDESAGPSQATSPSTVPSPGPQVSGKGPSAPQTANPVEFAAFESWLTNAWQRAAAGDLRGAELVLDELSATYDLDDSQNNRVWTFYGYIYTRYADYGRAIDAYEKAVATKTGYGSDLSTSLADLYFARHQYEKALKTLLAHRQRLTSGRISPEAAAMIEKLRVLGVTEETL